MLKNVYLNIMLRTTCILILSFIWLLGISGCTASSQMNLRTRQHTDEADPQADSLKDYFGIQTEDLLPYLSDRPVFFAQIRTLTAAPYIDPADRRLRPGEAGEIESTKKVISGYRVQLFSGHDQKIAKSIEARLKVNYQHKVFILYEAPLYKVRIGDFRNRDDAFRFCKQLIKEGFRSAWVVKSPINKL